MKYLFAMFFIASLMVSCDTATQEADDMPVEPEVQAPISLIDGTDYIEMAKAGLTAMTNQDLEGFIGNFTDDAVYQFNTGDSLAGIDAIREYWAGRMEVIDAITFSGEIWLPVSIMEGADTNAGPGNWLLAWYSIEASYVDAGSMTQSIHTAYHWTPDGKIDRVVQYLDRLSIMEAQQAVTTE